jgi:hypothetical protein
MRRSSAVRMAMTSAGAALIIGIGSAVNMARADEIRPCWKEDSDCRCVNPGQCTSIHSGIGAACNYNGDCSS